MSKYVSVISGLSGGLGNQMFQYAAARALSSRLDVPLKLDLSWFASQQARHYALADFTVSAEISAGTNWVPGIIRSFESRLSRRWMHQRMGAPILREPHFHFDPAFNKIGSPVYLEGFWQSERYFSKASDQIRRDFQLSQPLSKKRQAIAADIAKTNAISVHVRRGDYVSNATTQAFHGTCSPKWYETTMSKIATEVNNPTFFIFSDDPDWARNNLPANWPCNFIEPRNDGRDHEDMHLMSLCRHHIIANSSFSWWGAWLNPDPNKRVFAPAQWFANTANDTRDLLPDDWVKV